MKATYKGHEISVKRQKCMAGYEMLYYSIMRLNDGYFVVDGYEDSAETVKDQIGYMRERLDAEIEDGTTFDPTGLLPERIAEMTRQCEKRLAEVCGDE